MRERGHTEITMLACVYLVFWSWESAIFEYSAAFFAVDSYFWRFWMERVER